MKTETLKTKSPDYVRISLAAAMMLDLKGGLFHRNALSPCINVLLTYDSGCAGSCAYCGLSLNRKGSYKEKSFIRVKWDPYLLSDIIERIKARPGQVKRICISMITHQKACKDTITIAGEIRKSLDIPLSVLLSPSVTRKKHLDELKRAGVQMAGIAVDCAREDIFEEIRGKGVGGPHRWERYWECFHEALEIFGKGNVGIHLIVGLGESEREMVALMEKIHSSGGSTHLFSFFPEGNSRLSGHPRPSLGHYRRIQLARYLIDENMAGEFAFNPPGKLTSFGLDSERLEKVIASGLPFMTSGCPNSGAADCNRPYSDSMPGEAIRNFPFLPEPGDIAAIREELGTP
ncbi:MAG: radical SAM protein [Candidatus Eremiobacteraeota bacterium]|nr:radical SAM protein [Candidatus Eremiobacteraeota bacterium]